MKTQYRILAAGASAAAILVAVWHRKTLDQEKRKAVQQDRRAREGDTKAA